MCLNMVRRKYPRVGDIFNGFNSMWDFIGVSLMLGLISLVSMIPGGMILVYGAKYRYPLTSTPTDIIVLAVIGMLIIPIVVMIRWTFALWIVADRLHEGRVMIALIKSSEMTEGRRIEVFVVILALGLFGLAGILGLGIGVLFTAPIATASVAAYYIQLRNIYLKKIGAEDEDDPGEASIVEKMLAESHECIIS